jgi:hypothetical protein
MIAFRGLKLQKLYFSFNDNWSWKHLNAPNMCLLQFVSRDYTKRKMKYYELPNRYKDPSAHRDGNPIFARIALD